MKLFLSIVLSNKFVILIYIFSLFILIVEGNPNILDMYKVADNKYNVTLSIDMEDLPVCDPVVRESLLNARLQFHVIIPNNDKVVIMDGEPVIKYGDVVSKVHRDTMYSHFGLMINRFRKRMIDLIDVVLI